MTEREEHGRVEGCKVDGPPNLRDCYGCPAFRGVDRDGVEQGPFFFSGDLRAMTPGEYELWMDDPDEFARRMENGSIWNLRNSGTLEWAEFWAKRAREKYRSMTPEQMERHRERSRENMRVMRARQRRLREEADGRYLHHPQQPDV